MKIIIFLLLGFALCAGAADLRAAPITAATTDVANAAPVVDVDGDNAPVGPIDDDDDDDEAPVDPVDEDEDEAPIEPVDEDKDDQVDDAEEDEGDATTEPADPMPGDTDYTKLGVSCE